MLTQYINHDPVLLCVCYCISDITLFQQNRHHDFPYHAGRRCRVGASFSRVVIIPVPLALYWHRFIPKILKRRGGCHFHLFWTEKFNEFPSCIPTADSGMEYYVVRNESVKFWFISRICNIEEITPKIIDLAITGNIRRILFS